MWTSAGVERGATETDVCINLTHPTHLCIYASSLVSSKKRAALETSHFDGCTPLILFRSSSWYYDSVNTKCVANENGTGRSKLRMRNGK